MMEVYSMKNSSYIKRIAYCENCQLLRIKFIGGGVYEYKNVPVGVFADLKFHDKQKCDGSVYSPGRYYLQYIKGKYLSKILVSCANLPETNHYRINVHLCKPIKTSEPWKELFGKKKVSVNVDVNNSNIEFVYEGKTYQSMEKLMEAVSHNDTFKFIEKVKEVMELQLITDEEENLIKEMYKYRKQIKAIL